ncbi:hypothetical protein IGB42_00471 [Andreprevotia sp. IGB-42]|uniref:hypothetical protein n=1 Tax=Andreprevotia sp. IGB-42 TaxID=2497473 RepID=UPI00135C08B9|nr:hypothetical protein [Andreprevotia sp. IGB-42]KAF0815390.1 hypothetical protein IGB42_00471 [Andreprevotia sp. IGB-42]
MSNAANIAVPAMTSRSGWLGNTLARVPRPLLSFVCQGLVSGVSFLSSLAVLHWAGRDDYSAYVLFINAYVLLSSIQNALLLSPLVTLSGRMSVAAREHAVSWGVRLGVVLALLGGLVLMAYWHWQAPHSMPQWLWAGVPVGFGLLLFRDLRRAIWLLLGDLVSLLRLDIVYFLLSTLILLLAYHYRGMSLGLAIVAVALPALWALLKRPRFAANTRTPEFEQLDKAFRAELWACARWALPGVGVTWLFSNGYWFYLDAVQGKAAVALLAATRLFYTPIGLMIQGWAGYYRPVFARMEQAGQQKEKWVLVWRQVVWAAFIVASFAAVLAAVSLWVPAILPHFIDPQMWLLSVALWAVYFIIQWGRTVVATALLADPTGYRVVFQAGLAGCVLFYALFIPLAAFTHQPLYCPLALIVAEAAIALWLWKKRHV